MSENPYRRLPSVAKLLEFPASKTALARFPHDAVVTALRAELDRVRESLVGKTATETLPDGEAIVGAAVSRLEAEAAPRLRPVINATGIVLHTNLGRSPLHEHAARAAYEAARGYLNLELDLQTGKRSSRQLGIRAGVCRLTGAESATA